MSIMAWVRAARPAAQSNIAPSLLLGQALAFRDTGQFSSAIFSLLVLFGILDQLYIVFANDVADVETDRRNVTATPFSGGSRVVPEGQLSARALERAANASALLLLVVSGLLAMVWARPFVPLFGLLALVLLWAYSYPPPRMSYRGGGEVLQMVGIGVVLPTLGYYAQAGTLMAFPTTVLLATLPMQLAGAVATALPDAPSDRESGKHTLAVSMGQRGAQRLAVTLQLAGCAAYLVVSPAGGLAPATWMVMAIPLVATGVQMVLPTAVPGTRTMLLRVLLILTANAALTLGIAVATLAAAVAG